MADRVLARLRRHGFRYSAEHMAYAGAGHAVGIGRPYFSTAFVTQARRHPITGRMITPGGTPERTALAVDDAWRRVLAFLDTHLRGAR